MAQEPEMARAVFENFEYSSAADSPQNTSTAQESTPHTVTVQLLETQFQDL